MVLAAADWSFAAAEGKSHVRDMDRHAGLLLQSSSHGARRVGLYAYRVMNLEMRDLLTSSSSASAPIAARAMLMRSTSKNLRSSSRVSLRPNPSVPRVTYRLGIQVLIRSGTART